MQPDFLVGNKFYGCCKEKETEKKSDNIIILKKTASCIILKECADYEKTHIKSRLPDNITIEFKRLKDLRNSLGQILSCNCIKGKSRGYKEHRHFFDIHRIPIKPIIATKLNMANIGEEVSKTATIKSLI